MGHSHPAVNCWAIWSNEVCEKFEIQSSIQTPVRRECIDYGYWYIPKSMKSETSYMESQFRKYVNDSLTCQLQGRTLWVREVFPICNSSSTTCLKIYNNILNFVQTYNISVCTTHMLNKNNWIFKNSVGGSAKLMAYPPQTPALQCLEKCSKHSVRDKRRVTQWIGRRQVYSRTCCQY
jgi:hypothetical protein